MMIQLHTLVPGNSLYTPQHKTFFTTSIFFLAGAGRGELWAGGDEREARLLPRPGQSREKVRVCPVGQSEGGERGAGSGEKRTERIGPVEKEETCCGSVLVYTAVARDDKLPHDVAVGVPRCQELPDGWRCIGCHASP